MTAEEKAKELVEKFSNYTYGWSSICSSNGEVKDGVYQGEEMKIGRAKQCALITVDEILELYKNNWNIENSYWQEVKQEIEKL